jgi:hypothetical protein
MEGHQLKAFSGEVVTGSPSKMRPIKSGAPRHESEQFRNRICGDLDAWIDFNRTGAFQTPGGTWWPPFRPRN